MPDPDDADILHRIGVLADEERRLEEAQVDRGEPPSAEDRTRLDRIQVTLDQLWDLLRQRRALRHAGEDPDAAAARDAEIVERYQQ